VPSATPMVTQFATLDDWIPAKKKGQIDHILNFVYGVDFLPLAAGGTADGATTIQNDSDFLCLQMSRIVTNAANTTFFAAAPITIEMSDTGSGNIITNAPVHLDAYFGTAQLPTVLPVPLYLGAASTLRTRAANLDGATAFNLRIAYIGVKIFYRG